MFLSRGIRSPARGFGCSFRVRWTYYHPSSVFILKFSAPLFVASIFSYFRQTGDRYRPALRSIYVGMCKHAPSKHSNSHASQSALDPHSDDNLQDMHHTLHDSELICRPLRFSLSVLSLNAWRALKTITVQAGAGKCLACYG